MNKHTDNDECLNQNGGCSQKCENIPGSFICSCNSGYTLNSDGKTCKGKNFTKVINVQKSIISRLFQTGYQYDIFNTFLFITRLKYRTYSNNRTSRISAWFQVIEKQTIF